MAETCRALRALTLTLAVLMAWPWGVALSSLEATMDSAPAARLHRHPGGAGCVRRPGRAICERADCTSSSLVFDESEEAGDDGNLPALLPFSWSTYHSPVLLTECSRLEAPAIPGLSSPIAHGLHLRC